MMVKSFARQYTPEPKMNSDSPNLPPAPPKAPTQQLEYQLGVIKDPLRKYLWIPLLFAIVFQVGPMLVVIVFCYLRATFVDIGALCPMLGYSALYWIVAAMILARRKRLLTILDFILLGLGYPLLILLTIGGVYLGGYFLGYWH